MNWKAGAIRVLTSPPAVACSRRLLGRRATIFMLHRFAVPELKLEGHPVAAVRHLLAWLRRHEFELLPLVETLTRLKGEGPQVRGAVSFTIDDGYFDHAAVGAPVFAEFDCPVTTFVTTGFLDGRIWFWWDRIEYVFSTTRQAAIRVDLGGAPFRYSLATPAERRAAQADFTGRCKAVTDEVKHEGIAALARAAEVELPTLPPERYAPMPWETLRACEQRGMSFGPHTVTHPILSRTSDRQSEDEMTASWRRLKEQCRNPVPVFCYPNGQTSIDFGAREIGTLQRLGFLGAVTGDVGYSEIRQPVAAEAPFLINRFPFNEDLGHSIQYAGGLELVKQTIRRPLS
jgi:peptidoglycan/xylan/chitin deacetylase (PgdA/CDA1 family)